MGPPNRFTNKAPRREGHERHQWFLLFLLQMQDLTMRIEALEKQTREETQLLAKLDKRVQQLELQWGIQPKPEPPEPVIQDPAKEIQMCLDQVATLVNQPYSTGEEVELERLVERVKKCVDMHPPLLLRLISLPEEMGVPHYMDRPIPRLQHRASLASGQEKHCWLRCLPKPTPPETVLAFTRIEEKASKIIKRARSQLRYF